MRRSNLPAGKIGEDAACQYLKSHGFRIIERNFRKGYSEIDIVALDGKTLVFVEVKARYSQTYGKPEEAVTYWKMKSLIHAAQYYKLLHPKLPDSLRIDVVSVYLTPDNQAEKIELFKNITI